jgi:hypothetical protein
MPTRKIRLVRPVGTDSPLVRLYHCVRLVTGSKLYRVGTAGCPRPPRAGARPDGDSGPFGIQDKPGYGPAVEPRKLEVMFRSPDEPPVSFV